MLTRAARDSAGRLSAAAEAGALAVGAGPRHTAVPGDSRIARAGLRLLTALHGAAWPGRGCRRRLTTRSVAAGLRGAMTSKRL